MEGVRNRNTRNRRNPKIGMKVNLFLVFSLLNLEIIRNYLVYLLWFLNINIFFSGSNAEIEKKKEKDGQNRREDVKKALPHVENCRKKPQSAVNSRLDGRSEKLISLFGFDSGNYSIVIRHYVDFSV
jgi:hypothetical protein